MQYSSLSLLAVALLGENLGQYFDFFVAGVPDMLAEC